jgi:hypothetical protein
MKEWPSDPAKPIDFGDAIDPLKRALYHLYFLAPRHRSVDYDGYNLGKSELATTPTPKWALSEDGIAHRIPHGSNLHISNTRGYTYHYPRTEEFA